MKKVIVNQTGGADVLAVVEGTTPGVGHDEVLIDVQAIGVNYIDIYQRKGVIELPRPFTPGFEGVGVVRATGSGVTTLKVGSRVAWINCLGSYASQIVLPVAQALVVPEHFRVEEALLFQAVTAQYLLSEYRTVKPGDVVLVHAAAGGVGQLLVQWLKHLGAVVIGTASSEAKLDVVRSLGADHAINYADGEFLDAVLDVTNGRGVDIAFDAVGATTFASTLKALAPRGLALIYGQASGSAPAIDVLPLILNGTRVAGGSLFIYIQDPVELQHRAAAAIRGIEEGWLKLAPATCFALDDVAAAHAAIESRATQGKLVLVP